MNSEVCMYQLLKHLWKKTPFQKNRPLFHQSLSKFENCMRVAMELFIGAGSAIPVNLDVSQLSGAEFSCTRMKALFPAHGPLSRVCKRIRVAGHGCCNCPLALRLLYVCTYVLHPI